MFVSLGFCAGLLRAINNAAQELVNYGFAEEYDFETQIFLFQLTGKHPFVFPESIHIKQYKYYEDG